MTPRITVLVCVTDGTEVGDALRTVGSLGRQDERRWEAVLVAPDPVFAQLGARGRVHDRRVRLTRAPLRAPARPAELLPVGLAAARGEFVGVLAAGDQLEPGVLAAVVPFLDHCDVLYTDEQWAAPGAEGIVSKPDWLPANLEAYPYLGRLTLVRRDLTRRLGAFTPGADPEWDLALRATEASRRVSHVPIIGLTRARPPRTGPDEVAGGLAAVRARMARTSRTGVVEPAEVPLGVRTWLEPPSPPPLVSIVIPTVGSRRTVHERELVLVENCLRSLLELTSYPSWEVVLVTSAGTPDDVVERAKALLPDRLRIAPIDGDFNFAASINEGARQARGQLLLLLNDDTEVIEPRWLDRMVAVAQDPRVGAVGAKLLFGDGTIQHVGIAFGDNHEPFHPHIFESDDRTSSRTKALDGEWPAVTGACLLTPRSVFVEVGGFCTDFPLNYNDVDYCLKVRSLGHTVICAPFARLFHFESSSRTPGLEAWESVLLQRHWRLRILADPYVQYRSDL